jgi:hypothetical protein
MPVICKSGRSSGTANLGSETICRRSSRRRAANRSYTLSVGASTGSRSGHPDPAAADGYMPRNAGSGCYPVATSIQMPPPAGGYDIAVCGRRPPTLVLRHYPWSALQISTEWRFQTFSYLFIYRLAAVVVWCSAWSWWRTAWVVRSMSPVASRSSRAPRSTASTAVRFACPEVVSRSVGG